MPFPAIFITGTGTDVGKTIIAAALLNAAKKRNPAARYWKPIQTGGQEIDTAEVQRLVPLPQTQKFPHWSFPLGASPDQAAIAASAPAPKLQELLEAWESITIAPLIIEGAGGLLVPLNNHNETWRDFLGATNLPIVLVAQSGLGTLNHVLLTLEALDLYGLTVLAVVLNGPLHEANVASLKRMRPDHRFHSFPHLNIDAPSEAFEQASENLLNFILAAPRLTPNLEWLEADRLHCWHPYTQHQTAATPLAIDSARGIFLTTTQGEKLIDASASWWTNSLGHGHPRVGAAIAQQQRRLDHCIFAQATHEPGSRLAQALIKLSQGQLDRVFYSDNGSCAVEIGLKIASQSWHNQGLEQKNKFLFIQGSYHGDTFGAMAVGASESFHKAFSSYLFDCHQLAPVTSHRSRLCPTGSAALDLGLQELEDFFRLHASTLAAVIIEPWVQAASGMNVQDLTWLRRLGHLCKKHEVLLILDEVFTGMGRLGSYFAFLQVGLEPDIVCIAKGLTGGTLPLAATLTTEAIFQKFLSSDRSKALLHGHTFTGNATACAAALATLDVYKEERILANVLHIAAHLQEWIANQGGPLRLVEPRAIGAMAAWELPSSGVADYFHPLAAKIPAIARGHGLLLRTLGNTMYLVPPLSIKPAELKLTLQKIEATIRACE